MTTSLSKRLNLDQSWSISSSNGTPGSFGRGAMCTKAAYFKSQHGANYEFPEDPQSWDRSHNTATVTLTFHAGKKMLKDSLDIKKHS